MDTVKAYSYRCGWRALVMVILAITVSCPLAKAQGKGAATIQGTVTDSTGAVLAGVTVTATSPALITSSAITKTSDDGSYRIADVPVGTYRVQYELTGFQTVVREGIVLDVGFIAKIDVPLTVGSISQTITVIGASPIIDTSTSTPAENFEPETLDVLPTSRQQYSILSMTPGVTMTGTTVDIGGSNSNAQIAYKNYGTIGQVTPEIEGINFRQDADASGIFQDYYSFQTYQVVAASMGPEVGLPGTEWTGVVKSGGNEFHGDMIGAYQPGQLQRGNIDSYLRSKGVAGPGNKLDFLTDSFGDLGGRVIRDKVWFYLAWRYQDRAQTENNYYLDTILVPGVGLQPTGGNPIDRHPLSNQTVKLTYQVSKKYKLIGFYTRNPEIIDNITSQTQITNMPFTTFLSGSQNLNYIPWLAKGELQGTPNNQIVFNVQLGFDYFDAIFRDQPGQDVAGNPSQSDLFTGWYHGPLAAERDDLIRERFEPTGNLTYLPGGTFLGRHTLGTGFFIDWFKGGQPFHGKCTSFPTPGQAEATPYCSGNYLLLFNRINGLTFQPFEIQIYNNPALGQHIRMHNYSGYIKDQWQIGKRLTLNLGVRIESYHNYVIASTQTPGQFTSSFTSNLSYPGVDVLTWVSAAPRLGLAYDLHGNGKTVLKGSWGWYNWTAGDQGFTSNFDRNASTIQTYLWSGPCAVTAHTTCDYVPGSVNLNPLLANGSPNPAFVTQTAPGTAIVNPDLQQPRTYEATAGFERELRPNFSLRVFYVYRREDNIFQLVNPARPFSSYNVPIQVQDPGPDGKLGTADDGAHFTLYDVNPAFNGLAFTKSEYEASPGSNASNFHNIDIELNKRMSNKWGMLVAFTVLKNHRWLLGTDNAAVVQSPNDLINPIDDTWERDGKIEFEYNLPHGFTFSAYDNIQQGFGLQRTALFTGLPVLKSLTVRVTPFGAIRLPTLQVANVSVQKQFHIFGERRLVIKTDVYNVLNSNAASLINVSSGPSYGNVTSYLSPMVARIAAEFHF